MAYTKQNFTSGQVLTAQQLNHIEDGIETVAQQIDDIPTGGSGGESKIVYPFDELANIVKESGYTFDDTNIDTNITLAKLKEYESFMFAWYFENHDTQYGHVICKLGGTNDANGQIVEWGNGSAGFFIGEWVDTDHNILKGYMAQGNTSVLMKEPKTKLFNGYAISAMNIAGGLFKDFTSIDETRHVVFNKSVSQATTTKGTFKVYGLSKKENF